MKQAFLKYEQPRQSFYAWADCPASHVLEYLHYDNFNHTNKHSRSDIVFNMYKNSMAKMHNALVKKLRPTSFSTMNDFTVSESEINSLRERKERSDITRMADLIIDNIHEYIKVHEPIDKIILSKNVYSELDIESEYPIFINMAYYKPHEEKISIFIYSGYHRFLPENYLSMICSTTIKYFVDSLGLEKEKIKIVELTWTEPKVLDSFHCDSQIVEKLGEHIIYSGEIDTDILELINTEVIDIFNIASAGLNSITSIEHLLEQEFFRPDEITCNCCAAQRNCELSEESIYAFTKKQV